MLLESFELTDVTLMNDPLLRAVLSTSLLIRTPVRPPHRPEVLVQVAHAASFTRQVAAHLVVLCLLHLVHQKTSVGALLACAT